MELNGRASSTKYSISFGYIIMQHIFLQLFNGGT